MNPTDTNQASEALEAKLNTIIFARFYDIPDKQRSTIVKNLSKLIRTEKLKLLDELDKSMPTAEQLTTKYGYHMPEKQYGYKLALHDIREVLAKLEAEL